MRTWVRIVQNEAGALADAKEHLHALANEEDRLSKASTVEQLNYQRGKVDGIKLILSILTNNGK